LVGGHEELQEEEGTPHVLLFFLFFFFFFFTSPGSPKVYLPFLLVDLLHATGGGFGS
jgi:hypothetical protein